MLALDFVCDLFGSTVKICAAGYLCWCCVLYVRLNRRFRKVGNCPAYGRAPHRSACRCSTNAHAKYNESEDSHHGRLYLTSRNRKFAALRLDSDCIGRSIRLKSGSADFVQQNGLWRSLDSRHQKAPRSSELSACIFASTNVSQSRTFFIAPHAIGNTTCAGTSSREATVAGSFVDAGNPCRKTTRRPRSSFWPENFLVNAASRALRETVFS